MKRVRFIVKGDVQKVGYRNFVQKTARKLKVTGYVENLKDGNVRIVAEGEKETLNKFFKLIKAKEEPLVEVEDVSVNYEKATGEFKYFEIKRGELNKEMVERLDTAANYLKRVIRTMESGHRGLSENIRGMHQDVKGTRKDIKIMHRDMNLRFDKLDDAYGKFAQWMGASKK